MKYEEGKDEQVPEMEVLIENVAALTAIVQTQSDLLLVLVSKLNEADLPQWKTSAEAESDVAPKIEACIELVRKLYGPGKTNKS